MKKAIILAVIFILSVGLMAQSGSGGCDGSGSNGSNNQGSNNGHNGNGTGTGNGPLYDLSMEETISGEIQTVVFANCDGTGNNGYQLIVVSEGEEVYVVLAPTPFLLLQELTFTTGDLITMTGIFVEKSEGTYVFVVRTLTFESGETVDFRDEEGVPLWKGLGRH